MARRFFEELRWSDFELSFRTRNLSGQRLESFSMAGEPDDPEVAAIWRSDLEHTEQQLLSSLIPLSEVVFSIPRQHDRDLGPALIAGVRTGADTHRLAVVWERLPPGGAAPRFLFNADWGRFQGEVHGAWGIFRGDKTLFARSVMALPALNASQSPHFMATLWPHEKPRFGWGISLERARDLDGTPSSGPAARALAAVSTPWLVAPHQHRFGSNMVESKVVTVWRDLVFDPWTEEPFARAAHRERHIHCDALLSSDDFHASHEERIAKGFEILSVGTIGEGAAKIYAALYIRKRADPLAKSFFIQGLGNGRQVFEVPARVPPDARPIPWTSFGEAHPLDLAMRTMMYEYGIRVGQLAVVRRGELAFVRSYTFAEQGYPIATTATRMRWGSCSKAITASGLVAHYMRRDPADPNAGLRRGFAEELQIVTGDPIFNDPNAVTVAHAIQHKTGIDPADFGQRNVYEAAHPEARPEDDVPFWDKLLQAGDMRRAFRNWPQRIVTELLQNGQGKYHNYVYIALCELWGRVGGGGFGDYVGAAKTLLPAELQDLQTMLIGEGYPAARANLEAACHPSRIGVVPDPHHPNPSAGEHILSSYAGNPRFGSGAGWWALSAREMAAVMRQMTTGENPLWPTSQERNQIRRRGLGWASFAKPFHFRGGGGAPTPVPPTFVLHHNGEGTGCAAYLGHVYKGGDTLEICVAFHADGIVGELGNNILTLLIDAAQATEDFEQWAPMDLFGGFVL